MKLSSVKGYTEENKIIMEFFLSKIGSFQSNSRLLELAAKIPFLLIGNVRVKASDLFDSLDRNIERLFVGQDKLYENRQALKKYRTELKMIGLKSYDKISVDDIYSVATTLHNWSTNKDHLEHIVDKAKAFQEYIETNPEILQMLLRSSVTLGEAIRNLQCFTSYKEMFDGAGELCKQSVSLCMPSSLKIMQQWKLICLVRPVIESRCVPLSTFYQWHEEPSVDDVLENLKRVKKVISNRKYEQTLRSMVVEAFQYLHQRLRESIERKQAFVQNALIWTENGFCTPDRAIIEREGVTSINLSPYFKFIPREFENMRRLFLEIGCNLTEDKTVLARFLHDIREKYLQEHITGDEGFDRTRVSSVLDRLANETIDEEWLQSNVIIMVETTENRIEFAELTACVYDDEPEMYMEASDEGAQFKFVHPSLNHQTLIKLGVKSVTRSCLLAAEDVGIEEWGQNEQLTTRLNNILIDSYTDGLSVPKELIQNADDAHATQVSFLYDERKNNDAKQRLLSKQLEECQGPALWVYNDAVFTKDDLKNITKLHGATKKSKKTIGKFGLGFCSVYNLTDVPSFISGGYLVMFDPHGTYLEGVNAQLRSGIRIPLSKQMLIKRYEDQFKPYEGIFGCNLLSESLQNFNKSLFRLPLRTAKQADVSEISKKVYNNAEVKELLSMFMKTAGNLLLFCQNVKTVNLYHIQDGMSVTKASLCYTVRKSLIPYLPLGRNIILDAGEHFDQKKVLNINETVRIEQEFYPCNIWLETPCKTKNQSTWLVTWNMNPREHITTAIEHFPLTAVATPVDKTTKKILRLHELPSGYYNEGHLFCFLPLPVRTGLQFHINGFFNVTSDRKGLFVKTEDDKSDPGKIKWNNELLAKSVVKAFTDHLMHIVSMDLRCEGNIPDVYDLWPEKDKDVIGPFITGFYRSVIEENIPIFRGRDCYYAFDEILMLDARIQDSKMEDICYNMLINIPIDQSKSVIRIPRFVYKNIQKYNKEKKHLFTDTVLSMTKILPFFLCSIESPYWADKEEERNYLLCYAVLQDDPEIVKALKENRCFPTEPNGTFKKVSELVRHDSNIARMYQANEEIFISLKSGLREKNIMLKLIQLGMHDKFLPAHMLLGRCQSVLRLSKNCVECCRSRIKCILSYLKTTEGQRALVETDELKSVKRTYFLPVLTTPTDWKFSWRAESCEHIVVCDTKKRCKMHSISSRTLLLGQPKHLFPYSFSLCAGSVECIFDELFDGHTPQALITLLGLADSKLLSIDILVRQLDCLATEFTSPHDHYNQTTQRIYESIYNAFDRLSVNLTDQQVEESIKSSSKTILTKPIVLVVDTVVCPSNVVFNMKRSCPPDLFGLHNLSESQKRVFHKFGVKSECSVDDIINILKQKKAKWKGKQCNEVQSIVNLLINFENGMSKESKTYDDIHVDDRDFIVAPNSDGYLHPTHMLAIEDPEIITSKGLMLLHGDIAPNLARKIGVQTKRVQFLQSISTAVPFGQREKLTTRLKGLLKDYPCDEGIMKELIQNADDAGATEVHFIKFYGRHESKRAKSLEHQGNDLPALCVYNNSFFNTEDFIGIQNLGEGSKSDDPTKTGQFGVGFNAVYNLTDCPSFWTKGPGLDEEGELVLFDPLLKSIGDYSQGEPGIRFKVSDLNKEFPGTLKNYPPFVSSKGTVFRLPLRATSSPLSKYCITEKQLDDIMLKFTKNTADCLHFLKHVTCIKFMTYNKGKLSEDFKVQTLLSREDEQNRSQFFTKVKSVCEQNKENKLGNLSVDLFETTYKMTVKSSYSKDVKWLVTNTFGVKQSDQPLEEHITQAFDGGELGLLPFAGVSVRLPQESFKSLIESRVKEKYHSKTNTEFSPIKGVAYCFLPLPIHTGMPFNVNGHFALDRGRRGLWEEGFRKSWNECVLSCLVTEALNIALMYLQKYFEQDCKDIWHRQLIMNECVSLYYQHFPCLPVSEGAYWNNFVTSFYQRAFAERFTVFPALTTTYSIENRTSVKLDWVFPSCESDNTGGVFNVVRYFVKEANMFEHKHAKNVETTMDIMGIKLIHVLKCIVDTLRKTKCDCALYGDPNFVIQILKKNITGLELVQTSVLQNVEVVESLLRYVWIAENFKDKLVDLPLCLTNDSILRLFSKNFPVFCTEYYGLLPGSPDKFVHANLLSWLSPKNVLLELNVVINFEVQNMLELLPMSYPDIYCHSTNVRWDKTHIEEHERVKPEMIVSFFNFIESKSFVKCKITSSPVVDDDLFKKNLCQFADWSFLPSVSCLGKMKTFELIPIKNRHHLLFESFGNETLFTIIRRLNIPLLDRSLFKHSTISYRLGTLLPSTTNPSELLKCLVYYKARIAANDVKTDEVATLLNFFYENRKKLEKSLTNRTAFLIKSLPLYETLPDGTYINIEDKSNVVIMPSYLPTEGLCNLAQTISVWFLQNHFNLLVLYAYLELPRPASIDVYLSYILPHFGLLQESCWMHHLLYIKDNLLLVPFGSQLSKKQKAVLNILKQTTFIRKNGQLKLVKELYDEEHEVHRIFMSEDKFLPNEFRNETWNEFMIQLGLITKPSGQMVIDFAKELAQMVNIDEADSLDRKSRVLTNCVFGEYGDKFDDQTYFDLKHIKFVLPHQVTEAKQTIFRSYSTEAMFISLNGTCSSRFEDVCWSSVSLLNSVPDNDRMQKLGILDMPTVDSVISHCQNITEVFYEDFENRGDIEKDTKRYYMEQIYEYLNNTNELTRPERLKHTRFVLISDEKAMVKVSNVFTGSSKEQAIPPYLFQAPKEFRKYFDLFEKIGAKDSVSYIHYVSVLNAVNSDFEGDLPKTTLYLVSKAVEKLFEQLLIYTAQSSDSVDSNINLFLPNSEQVMSPSASLTIDDNYDFRTKLNGKLAINYFVGFRQLNVLKFSDPVKPFLSLPSQIRPEILSEVVSEIVITNEMEIVESSVEADDWEHFLHSTEFVEGIIRLLRHQSEKETATNYITEEEENEIMQKLSNVMVSQVNGLKTKLAYKGEIIQGTDTKKTCFVSKMTNNEDRTDCEYYQFYFQTNITSRSMLSIVLVAEENGLIVLVDLCTLGKFSKRCSHIMSYLLDFRDKPHEISLELDRRKIAAYNLPLSYQGSVFPNPGTYVEDRFLPFLVQGIIPFKKHEYMFAALEIEFDDDGEDPENGIVTYIYVHILSEIASSNGSIHLGIRYIVNVGDRYEETVEVPIYRLYRFLPQTQESSQDVVVFDSEPVGAIAFDENCRRIREMLTEAFRLGDQALKIVIRRLIKKWHPDKNVGNESYCTRIYNYLRELILRLERGESINEEIVNATTGMSAPDMSGSSYKTTTERAYQTGGTYARGYRANIDEYNRSFRQGHYSHRSSDSTPRPSIGESRRWLRQAKQDYSAAKRALECTEHIQQKTGNNIPSDMFHDDDARFAVESAKRMLDIVDDFTN
ncbi:SACS-like protein [Mya arenaria]|uniref:SACS-like protein n=1 Tax=Mya arenaria TaxID=6604 RepID=A0ABY7ET19_MYAAR|nr:SACS-like protein [Mya arenaria]